MVALTPAARGGRDARRRSAARIPQEEDAEAAAAKDRAFYSDDEDDSGKSAKDKEKEAISNDYVMDPDHRSAEMQRHTLRGEVAGEGGEGDGGGHHGLGGAEQRAL